MARGHHVPSGVSVRVVTPAGEKAPAGSLEPPEEPVEDLLDDD